MPYWACNLRDAQYRTSLAISATAAAAVLLALAGVIAVTGWKGAAAVLAAPGLFLGWFYAGSRPDLVPRDGSGPGREGEA